MVYVVCMIYICVYMEYVIIKWLYHGSLVCFSRASVTPEGQYEAPDKSTYSNEEPVYAPPSESSSTRKHHTFLTFSSPSFLPSFFLQMKS